MSGHRPFSELTKDFSPERQARVKAKTQRLQRELKLQELHETKITLQMLRETLGMQQEELGELLGIKQAAVSRMEGRDDIHLSNLRKVIEAMGGELVVIARFSDVTLYLEVGDA